MKKIAILILVFILCGCSNSKNEEISRIMEEKEYLIVDVRTKIEYETSHIVGAINIPYDEIDDSLSRDKFIFVYCMSGTRSKIAYDNLKKMGYNVYDLGSFDKIDLPKTNNSMLMNN